ncbi:MAG: DNA cytosine methyltransferase [Mesorhizobium sp.]|nr:MAG: DNA cytosine methyltransferase [Mesorhizobium sp.]TKC02172.1 MAG: DNA cytosine methyltransferase [Mesorhizobium sp.]
MAGVLNVVGELSSSRDLAELCLSLPVVGEVPLKAALSGLGEPVFVGTSAGRQDMLSIVAPLARNGVPSGTSSATARYLEWISQPRDPQSVARPSVDSHMARLPRRDDSRWFSLMGPGTRWMDYRCDDSHTLHSLASLLRSLIRLPANDLSKRPLQTNKAELQALLDRLDGSLSIRLLLEQAEHDLEAENHLVSDAYLTKRDGNHGDWLARLDGEKPCKTIVAHMGKDTYGYVHPWSPRTLSVREAARVQSFPDSFSFAGEALTEAFKMIGNAVPPLLSHHLAVQIAQVLHGRRSKFEQIEDEVERAPLAVP